MSQLRSRIEWLLTQPYPYGFYRCTSCGEGCGHKLEYCYKCPGKMVRVVKTYKQELMTRFHLNKDNPGVYRDGKDNLMNEYWQLGVETKRQKYALKEEIEENSAEFHSIVDEIIKGKGS